MTLIGACATAPEIDDDLEDPVREVQVPGDSEDSGSKLPPSSNPGDTDGGTVAKDAGPPPKDSGSTPPPKDSGPPPTGNECDPAKELENLGVLIGLEIFGGAPPCPCGSGSCCVVSGGEELGCIPKL